MQERYELSKHISDDAMLDELLFSSSRKQNIRSALDMSQLYFQGLMTSLRKKQVIVEGRLNPKFIPKGLKDGSSFGLLFEFDFDGNCTSKGI